MKKPLALLLTLLFVLSMTACGTNDEGGSLDAVRGFANLHASLQICTTEDTIYYADNSSQLVYYIDRATGISAPLCGKPECPHNGSTCNAYYPAPMYGLCVYDGRLYFVGNLSVFSIALDGTDRQAVRNVAGLTPYSSNNMYMMFHRGYLYLAAFKGEIVDGERHDRAYVCAVPLDPDEEGSVILEEETAGILYISHLGDVTIQPYGDDLYIITRLCTGYSEEGVPSYNFTIRRWDTIQREMETLYYEDSVPFRLVREMWVLDDSILFKAYEDAKDMIDIYRFYFDGAKIELQFSVDGHKQASIADGRIVGAITQDDGSFYAIIKDFEGNTISEDTLDLEWPDRPRTPLCCGSDSEWAYYVYYYSDEDDISAVYIYAVSLNGDGIHTYGPSFTD